MDSAIIGTMRIGYFRIGLFLLDDWNDKLLKRFKNVATPSLIKVDEVPSMVLDEPPYYRVDVLTDHWKLLKNRFKKVR